jgi:hypothetical protein
VAAEACRGRSCNTYIFSHGDVRNRLDSHTKLCSKFTNTKTIRNGTTNLRNIIRRLGMYITNPFSKNFAKFSLLFPRLQLLVQVSLSVSCSVGWPPFVSIGSLALWLCGPLALCLFLAVCLQSMCCLLDLSAWFWSPGFPSWWSGAIPGTLGLCFCICHPFSLVYFLS